MSVCVSPAVAADVLGWTRPRVYYALQNGLVSWGFASKRRTNHIHTIYSAKLAEFCGMDEAEIVRRELEYRAKFRRSRRA